ncbi:sodium:calcium antiporter [Methylocystis echinoides]|uniref:sodium:calcium antiporter n=1 Tax=Methylocystis echinoides TaxID=29468 RepID=UPI0034289E95
MFHIVGHGLWSVAAIFLVAAVVIAFAGTKLARIADALADRTGMGEIIAGALFVGASTSLPGEMTSITTAAQGAPSIAIGNALGGLTVQTMFLAVADLAYRRANLEHAAASVTGLAQGVLLVTMLTIPLIASVYPAVTVWGVHPASLLIVLSYGFGLRLLSRIQRQPMWHPVKTEETRPSLSKDERGPGSISTQSLWVRFAAYALVTAACGYAIGEAAIWIVANTGFSESIVGTVLAAVANSLPELVTAIAAVRIGAVNLAVGDVIGGNAFEVLFLSAADLFQSGSIYHFFTPSDQATALIAILMTGVLLLGMLRREKAGIARIGFESALVLLLYVCSVGLVFLAP